MRRLTTIIVVLLIGAATAWWSVPAWRLHRAIQGAAEAQAEHRAQSWRYLVGEVDGVPRMTAHLDSIDAVLADASDEALLDGASWMSTAGLWDWEHHGAAIMLRTLQLQAEGTPGTQLDAVERMARCPLDAPPDAAVAVFTSLVQHGDPGVRRAALRAACGWAGPQRTQVIADLPVDDDDVGLRRAQLLAVAAGDDPAPVLASMGVPPASGLLLEPAGIVEAWLVALARGSGEIVTLEKTRRDWTASPSPAFASILRWWPGPEAADMLRTLADDGDRVARFALQARSPGRDRTAAQHVAADDTEPPWRRRMAAWRWPNAPDDLVDELMEIAPAELDTSVYAAILLADRMKPKHCGELAAEWIRDFDDDAKRAGALLSALSGDNLELLRRAHEAEDIASVRLAQRLALHALGERVPGPDPLELAHAALRREDGDFFPDIALCLLAAGEPSMLPLLTSQPRQPWRASTQQRAWLIERFVPNWHARFGRPLGGDARGLRLHFDLLEARNALTCRRLRFDTSTRTFQL